MCMISHSCETKKTQGAENMIITALCRLEHIPNLKETKEYGTIFSRMCGSKPTGHIMTMMLILTVINMATGGGIRTGLNLITVLIYELCWMLGVKIVSPWQRLTVAKPDDDRLERGLAALEDWVEKNVP